VERKRTYNPIMTMNPIVTMTGFAALIRTRGAGDSLALALRRFH